MLRVGFAPASDTKSDDDRKAADPAAVVCKNVRRFGFGVTAMGGNLSDQVGTNEESSYSASQDKHDSLEKTTIRR